MNAVQIKLAAWALKWFGFMIGDAVHKRWEKQIKDADAKKVVVMLAIILLSLSTAGCAIPMSWKRAYVDTWHHHFPDPVVTNGVPIE